MLILISSMLGIGYFFALLPSFTRSSYWLPTLQGVRQKTNSSKVSLAHIYHSRQTNLIETYQRWPLLGHQGEEAWFLIHPTRFPKLALCSQLVLQAARKDWRTRSSSHMHPSDIIAKLQRQFGDIPTTARVQAAWVSKRCVENEGTSLPPSFCPSRGLGSRRTQSLRPQKLDPL